MGSTCRRFTKEYKAQAVEFVIDALRSIVEVARNIGVHEMTLGKWVKKARESDDSAGKPLEDSERAELAVVRGERPSEDAGHRRCQVRQAITSRMRPHPGQ
ncbi:transposase [Amycolatopsis aidingensis]|uniref:transposase n=1 Tax=Amycolatopsis aidingensis TaxID=2842453 RepID=UPI001C0E2A91|nr:transposase [Amycolatopsis aidingensis]